MQSRGIVNRVTPDVVPERRNIDINKYLMNDNDIYMIKCDNCNTNNNK